MNGKIKELKKKYAKALSREKKIKGCIDKERVTTKLDFGIYIEDEYDALANESLNVILIGKKAFTVETLIHELNEIELNHILNKLGYGNPWILVKSDQNKDLTKTGNINNEIAYYKTFLSHLLSPYGYRSFIYPCVNYKDNEGEEALL